MLHTIMANIKSIVPPDHWWPRYEPNDEVPESKSSKSSKLPKKLVASIDPSEESGN
jgi:hypothetical protein